MMSQTFFLCHKKFYIAVMTMDDIFVNFPTVFGKPLVFQIPYYVQDESEPFSQVCGFSQNRFPFDQHDGIQTQISDLDI